MREMKTDGFASSAGQKKHKQWSYRVVVVAVAESRSYLFATLPYLNHTNSCSLSLPLPRPLLPHIPKIIPRLV